MRGLDPIWCDTSRSSSGASSRDDEIWKNGSECSIRGPFRSNATPGGQLTRRETEAGDSRAAVRHLGGQTAVVMGGTVFTFLVGLPFQVYLARTLGTVGLGTVGIAEAVVTMAAGLLSFGLAPLAVRYIPEYRQTGNAHAIRVLLLVALVLLSGLGTIGAVLIRPLAAILPGGFGIGMEAYEVLDILRLLLPVSMVSFLLAQSLRGFQEIRVMVFSTSVLALVSKLVLTLGLFATLGVSAENYARALVISQAVPIAPMGWYLWRLSRALPPASVPIEVDWRGWASYAGTNYASGLTGAVMGNLDRIVIGTLLGPASVGVLMVVRQLKHFPSVFHHMLLTVVSPVFAQLKATGNMSALAHQMHLSNDWIMRMAAGLILVLAILPDFALRLYGPSFSSQGTVLMLVMALTVAVEVGSGPVGMLLNMTGNHVAMLRVSILASVVTLGAFFVLIPLFGLAGAGLAALFGAIVNNAVAIRLVKSRLGISWYDPRFRGWILPSVAAAAVLLATRPLLSGLDTLGTQAAGLVAAVLVAYGVFCAVNLASGLHEDDRELIRAVDSRIARGVTTRRSRP